MAIINCPECDREISDKSEICIYCGYPIAKEKEKKLTEEKKAQIACWNERIAKVKDASEDERLAEYIAISDEGYIRASELVGDLYWNKDQWELALKYYLLVYEKDPGYHNWETALSIAELYALKKATVFNPERAMYYMRSGDTAKFHKRLGDFYNPLMKNDGFEDYKNCDLAIEHYKKAIEMDKRHAAAYSNLGTLYGDIKERYVVAASYSLLAHRLNPNSRISQHNYEIYLNRVREKHGAIWEKNIMAISSADDIDPMIERVNAEICNPSNTNNHQVHCPNCNSISTKKISTGSRVFSMYMWGIFSSKFGKQFECNNCGYKW